MTLDDLITVALILSTPFAFACLLDWVSDHLAAAKERRGA